ncbi:SH3 domain-containing protein [Lutibacter oricola]|uniref:SH3 domain-containing protein n=1 Tax=Lutibacter oricola TaxID=762486 RepID=A0A1H3GW12_9FLAO|nr:SH3 domain-containing protein [Lutibacter oricola]SDY07155.1 SH3 domain-containing protein [Lutibacter oricola]
MKKIILILTLILTFQTIFSQSETRYVSRNFNFQSNQTEYLFADNVKFRENPNLDSKIIDLLSIDSQIKIIEKTEKTLDFDGVKSNWYKIKVDNKIGFVLGALISVYNLEVENTKFKFQIKSNEKNDIYLKVRVISNNRFEQFEYKLIGEEFSIDLRDNQNLNNLDNMIIVDYLAEACGVENGKTYIFWNNEKLYHIADLSSMADGGMYSYSSYFIFPKSINGIKDKIIYKRETETMEDEETNWRKESIETRELIWNGEKLIPDLRNIKND